MASVKKRIIIFLLLTFITTYAGVFILIAKDIPYGGLTCQIVFMLLMFLPALSSILTRLITKEGWRELYLKLNFKGHVQYYVWAWLGPGLLVFFGAVVYFLLFPADLDINMSYYKNILAGGEALNNNLIVPMFALAWILGGIINIIPALGEELGWRGYLLPKLLKLTGAPVAILVDGIIWGLWHAPMIAMGHNYGTGYTLAPWGGILAMTVFCIFMGAFLSYLTLIVRSAIPAALAHGALNAIAGAPVMFVSSVYNPFIGPTPTGILGGAGIIAAGVICFILAWRNRHRLNEEEHF